MQITVFKNKFMNQIQIGYIPEQVQRPKELELIDSVQCWTHSINQFHSLAQLAQSGEIRILGQSYQVSARWQRSTSQNNSRCCYQKKGECMLARQKQQLPSKCLDRNEEINLLLWSICLCGGSVIGLLYLLSGYTLLQTKLWNHTSNMIMKIFCICVVFWVIF